MSTETFETKKTDAQTKFNAILKALYPKDTPQIDLKPNSAKNYNEYYYELDAETQKTKPVGTNNKLEVRVFNKDSYGGPKTEDFIQRAESLHKAAVYMISPRRPDREKTIKNLEALLKKTIAALEEKAALQPHKMQAADGADYFSERLSIAQDILQDFIIDSLDAFHDGKPYSLDTAIRGLEQSESKLVAKEGRANLVHVYEAGGHTRVSIAEAQGNHTNPSTMRDKPELSNFVKTSSGYIDENGNAQIEFSGYRHSSYSPIKIAGNKIENKMERRAGAADSVKQMIQTLAQDMLDKHPELYDTSKQPFEIKLSTMMLLTPLLNDKLFMGTDSEIRQLKDSLIALNIFNHQEITLKLGGKEVKVKPVLTQMNIPANGVMKAQFKKMGGEFNDNVNNKGFYEYNKNFQEFIQKARESDPEHLNIIKPLSTMYENDAQLENLEKQLENLQAESNLPKLYAELGELQKDRNNPIKYKEKLTEIRAAEKALNIIYKSIINRQQSVWKESHQDIEQLKVKIYDALQKNPDDKTLQATQLYLDSAEIYHSKAHKMAEHGHQFQTRYLLANHLMGNHVEYFCKSGEDRTGRANNHLEEFLAFRRENKFFPRFNNEEDRPKLETIALAVHNCSVSTEITNQNAPGARGLQQGNNFGSNKILRVGDFGAKNGRMAKGVYAISIAKKIKHKLKNEFNALSNQFRQLIKSTSSSYEKLESSETGPLQTAPSDSKTSLQNTELLTLKAEADQIFEKLAIDTQKLSNDSLDMREDAKKLIKIYQEIRLLRSSTTDKNFREKVKKVETEIDDRLGKLTQKLTQDIDEKTGRPSNHSAKTAISGTSNSGTSKPALSTTSQILNDMINKIKSVFHEPEFAIKANHAQSVFVKKQDEENPFMSVTAKEIQSLCLENSVSDYKLMIQAAAKMFDKPLLIYVPEAEKPKLDAAIQEIIKAPKSSLDAKQFECTTNREEYETKQKLKAEAPEEPQEEAKRPSEPDERHGLE